mmetsp:Transcript_11490/g.40913  ORF Transcript_11490/g.40913 Transcript_11490/m.40913 type:complete len:160 (+) Transcript_11490:113-592(+)
MGASCSASLSENIKHLQSSGGLGEDPSVAKRLAERLQDAVQRGDAEAARRALDDGAPPNVGDEAGWMPLHYAASKGEVELCRLLLEFQGDANAALPDLSTPLMLAVEEAHLPVATLLLEGGALTKCKDEDGFTALSRCDPSIKEEFARLTSALPPEPTR